MPRLKTAAAGTAAAVGTLALVGTLVGSAPEPGPAAVPAAALLPAQPEAWAAPAQPEEARSASTTPKTVMPKAAAQPAVAEQPEPKPEPARPKRAPVPVRRTGGDRDYTDFGSHEEVQRFFLANGGPSSDPHKLDRDHDGLACESN
jgi:hypothetical protein